MSKSSRPRIHRLSAHGIVALFGTTLGSPNANAELPALTEKQWLGQFAVYKNRDYQITISSHGDVTLSPLNKDGDLVGAYLKLRYLIGLEERLPNGRVRRLAMLPESLESTDPATDKLEKIVFRGKVTGGAAFETTVEQKRGVISFTGRVTDPGTESKNPLAFSINMRMPYFFAETKKDTPELMKAFETKIKNDYAELKWTDGKRHKQDFLTPVNAASPEINGPGIASAEFELTTFRGKKLLLSASEHSSIRFSNPPRGQATSTEHKAPLYEGFLINWGPDQIDATPTDTCFSVTLE